MQTACCLVYLINFQFNDPFKFRFSVQTNDFNINIFKLKKKQ